MTYCIGIKANDGLVFASDSRTNAGLDLSLIHISEPTRQPLISSAASDVYKRQFKNIA